MKGTTAVEWVVAGIIFLSGLFVSYYLVLNAPVEVRSSYKLMSYNISREYISFGCYEWGLARISGCYNSSGCIKVGEWLLVKANVTCKPCPHAYSLNPSDIVYNANSVNNTNISIFYDSYAFEFSFNQKKCLENKTYAGSLIKSELLQNESFLINYTDTFIILPSYASTLLLIFNKPADLMFNLTNDYASWQSEKSSGDFSNGGEVLNENATYLCINSSIKTLCFSSYANYVLYNESNDLYLNVKPFTDKLYITFRMPSCLKDVALRYGVIKEERL